MDKTDLKNKAWLIFAWYGIGRWLLLPNSNPASHDWSLNILGNSMAILTIAYLLAFIFITNIEKSKLFFAGTIALTAFNLYCFITMGDIFIGDPSLINFGYVMMDFCILTFFNVMCIFCKYTVYGTNQELNGLIKAVQ
jgi:hypothetical protein